MRIRLVDKNLNIVFENEAEELIRIKPKDKNLKDLLNKLDNNKIDYILYLEKETNKTFIIKKV